jgi:predicted DNA-binding transcriptional regulator AlpA
MPAKRRRRLLTARDVARQLEVSVRTVWRLVELGRLCKPRKQGTARWFQKDVDVYLWRLMRGDFDEDDPAEQS